MPPRALTATEAIDRVGFDLTPTGCKIWLGKRTAKGYALYNNRRVSRLLVLEQGYPLGPTEVVRHTCDTPPCVEGEHLVVGTAAENSADMVERRRHWMHDRRVCDHGHDLTLPGATRRYADGSTCVQCRRNRGNRYVRTSRRTAGPAEPGR